MQPTLPWILATLAAALFLGAAVVWRLNRRSPRQRALPSEWAVSARPVFSTDERRAFRHLREALPHHIILSKLPLVRFCQPLDPKEVRYWYELLAGNHVTFAICSANGRVLAAIDLDNDRSPSRRSGQIKQSVLAACRVRYLRCPADHLPSIPELQLLVPQATMAVRGPQAAAAAAYRLHNPATSGLRREFTTLWQDSAYLQDSFFGADGRQQEAGANSSFGFRQSGMGGRDSVMDMDDVGGVVIETPSATRQDELDLPVVIEDPVGPPPSSIAPASQMRH